MFFCVYWIKIDNYKFGLIFFQILLFYFSILIFSLILKKKVNAFIYKIILIFLCLEPSILQWHSTLWTESIFLSLMLLCFAIILSKTDSSITNFILGILIGLLFFGIEYFLLGLGCFVMGFSFFSLVNNQSGSKGITEPYKGKSGKTYTAKQDREEHIV